MTPAQRSVLVKGPNFAVTPRQPPNLEYITAIEAACTKLSQQDAEELRANINRVLRSSHPPKPNLTKAQMSALRELKKDRDRIVLTADKGVAMIVMDRQDYINKANHLLNQNTYKTIIKDPTNTIKNKLINILKTIKTKSGLGTSTYKSMYPTGCVPPKFYGLPKIHKPDTPLRPIVSSCGSVTYGVAKELVKILKPLVGQSPHHINSTQDFVEQAKHFKLESGECLSSYDVSALFTSVPIDPALNIIKDLLVKDNTLKERTVMDLEDIILLLEFCLKNTSFSFQGQFYEQVEGAAMGSPVSPIVANLYMEYLEQKALSTAPHPPKFWGRYVDDTFVIHKEANKQGFLQHINSVDPAIRFTVEDNKEDGSIPFLDTIVNLRLMVLCPLLYTGNPHIQTSIYSGTVTITSQPSLVSSKLFPTGLPPCAVILSCFKKKRSTSGKLSPNATTPNGLCTRWRKDLTGLPDRSMMGATTVPKLPTKECKVRVILSFPTHKVFVKVSKRSVVGMASKLTSRVAQPSKTFWSPPRTKTLLSTKVVPSIGTNVVT